VGTHLSASLCGNNRHMDANVKTWICGASEI